MKILKVCNFIYFTEKNLNRFQIALNPGASYDSMCTNHGVYIKFRGSDNNQLHSSHDSLVEELIDDVGNNVIVFEIPGKINVFP